MKICDLFLPFFSREELEKQRAAAHYQRLHAEGKTEEARQDLARLAIIKQQREEAARKREEEKKRMSIFFLLIVKIFGFSTVPLKK